ncbi:hypothetical protein FQN57_006699 [Myotisia sp. PD_48]|nr:hypothetical protein FQN57_006699 [Myotisia sp. PD_48]
MHEHYQGNKHLVDSESHYYSNLEVAHRQHATIDEGKQIHVITGQDKFTYFPPNGQAGPPAGAPSYPSPSRRRSLIWIISVLSIIIILLAILLPVGLLIIRNNDPQAMPSTGSPFPSGMNPSSPASSAPTTQPGTDPKPGEDPPTSGTGPGPSSPTDTNSPNTMPERILDNTNLAIGDARNGDVVLYYQDRSLGLSMIPMSRQRKWQGSKSLGVKGAKKNSPLTTVFTSSGDKVYIWLFYVDEDNIIQCVWTHNEKFEWTLGSIGNKKFKVPDSPDIAFDTRRGSRYDTEKRDLTHGLTLFAASDKDSLVHEYIYTDEDQEWNEGFVFENSRSIGGVASFYVFSFAFVYTHSATGNKLNLWWRDYQDESPDWHLGPSSPTTVMPGSAVSGTLQHVTFQAPDGTIRGYNMTDNIFTPPNMRWDTEFTISEGPVLKGTGLSYFFFYSANSKTMMHSFYQEEKGSITEAIRDWAPDNRTVPGTWRYSTLPIT